MAFEKEDCVYCQIVKKTKPSHIIWEDDEFVAFLSIFPNTEGQTTIASKEHYSGYAFEHSEAILCKLLIAAKSVIRLLEEKLHVNRVAFVLEGVGINHLHAKLFPLHGAPPPEKWTPAVAHIDQFFNKYEGYISTHDYVRAEEKDLERIVRKITQ